MQEPNQERLEFCWICRQHKPANEIDMTEGNYTSGICIDCQKAQETKLAATGGKVIQTLEHNVWSDWYSKYVTYRYISVSANGKVLPFIRRYATIAAHYDTYEVFAYVNQFIANGYQWIKYYGDLDLLTKYDFWWYVEKIGEFYKFGGNCFEYSNAFSLETLELQTIFNLIEAWTPLPKTLKQRVKDQLDKGLVFASNPEGFERTKILCFKEYTKEHRDPKITILKNLVFPTITA